MEGGSSGRRLHRLSHRHEYHTALEGTHSTAPARAQRRLSAACQTGKVAVRPRACGRRRARLRTKRYFLCREGVQGRRVQWSRDAQIAIILPNWMRLLVLVFLTGLLPRAAVVFHGGAANLGGDERVCCPRGRNPCSWSVCVSCRRQPVVVRTRREFFSTTDNGAGQSCVSQYSAVPWTYSSCCSTCPTFGLWFSSPRPEVKYLMTEDTFGRTVTDACGTVTPATGDTGGHIMFGIDTIEYYVR